MNTYYPDHDDAQEVIEALENQNRILREQLEAVKWNLEELTIKAETVVRAAKSVRLPYAVTAAISDVEDLLDQQRDE